MSNVNERIERIRKRMEQRLETYARKNELYGDSFNKTFKAYGPVSALSRIRDKVDRAETLILNPEIDPNNESLIDTLMDLANYCDMTIEALEADEEAPKPKNKPKRKRKRKSERKAESKKVEPKKEPTGLDRFTRDQLVTVAKSLGLSPSNKTSKAVISSMIEKEFDSEQEMNNYLETVLG